MDEFFFESKLSRYQENQNKKEKVSKKELEEYRKLVSYSPEMTAYLKELNHVTNSLKIVNSLSQFYEKSLLVSIDDGWGYSEFLKVIREELMTHYGNVVVTGWIKEENYPTDKGISVWEKRMSEVSALTDQATNLGGFAILSFDMRNWMSEFSNPAFLQYIREIGDRARNILIVFRIPFLDTKVVTKLEENLSNVISLRTIEVPPVSVEYMREYLKTKLSEANFDVEPGCDDSLEQWIYQEKFDEHFYGYKTLEKMASELIYQKALQSKASQEYASMLNKITSEDIRGMLSDSIEIQDPYELLEELIGLSQLKVKIKELVAQLKFQKELNKQGKSIEKPVLHMMFTGNPGTGKTTVARIIGQIFKKEGLLRKGHFIEVMGGSFVTGNISTTVQKVRTACKDAYGSILFIDEAYSMSVGHSGGNVTDEILPILVTEMENHREDLCVIMAGYKEEMEEFLKENSGLKSRIPHILDFPNYKKEELIEIFFHMVRGNFEYETELRETLEEYLQNLPESEMETKEFSNARFVRNLYERLWGKAAYRVSLGEEKEVVLTKDDLQKVIKEEEYHTMLEKKSKRKIGYL